MTNTTSSTTYDHDQKAPYPKPSLASISTNESANPYASARSYTQHRTANSGDSREDLIGGAAPVGGASRYTPPPRPPMGGYSNNGYGNTGYGNSGYGNNGYENNPYGNNGYGNPAYRGIAF